MVDYNGTKIEQRQVGGGKELIDESNASRSARFNRSCSQPSLVLCWKGHRAAVTPLITSSQSDVASTLGSARVDTVENVRETMSAQVSRARK